MQRLLVIIALSLGMAVQGCSTIQDMNPFQTRPLNASETIYGQFSNIPVPRDLTHMSRRSFTNYAPDGAKNGMETYEANVDQTELTRAMVSHMVRDGWAVRAALSGAGRDVQVYEQQNIYAVIYYYRQTATTTMEIWVGSRLADGTYKIPGPSGSGSPGGIQERPLP